MGTSRVDGWCVASFRQTKAISLEDIAYLTKLKVSTLQAPRRKYGNRDRQ